ncbi:MAG: tRNA (adenosine(37)-N6)-threonylcarbamoyltransferase complex ATPase subunit type 1 TsaE [Alphaproteobacteria bacterium]|nr:tRNA (adenosine(37)-N6)-threonylcarbamoyltransferase complex ATPase subunit type 1 TsaE [Alphaproteobacteria bacterium]
MGKPILTVRLRDEAATSDLAGKLAAACRPGDVIALEGELGAGKTTLARSLIRTLAGAEIEVPSPTFTLVQTYALEPVTVWHFDLYRLERAGEARELGLEEAVDGLALIEWPERLGTSLPLTRLEVQLSFCGDGRIARLVDHGDWSGRIDGDWR